MRTDANAGAGIAAFSDVSTVSVLPPGAAKSLLPSNTRSFPASGPLGTVIACVKGWSALGRLFNVVISVGPNGLVVRRKSIWPVPAARMPAYSALPLRLKAVVISPVPVLLPGALGTMALSCQVAPPFCDAYTGALFAPPGLGEKAVPMICAGLAA